MKSIVKAIDQVNEFIGDKISWISLILVIIICIDVSARYLFNFSTAWIAELEWHLFAIIFLLSAGYTFKKDKHVRVDAFYHRFSPKTQHWINFLGGVFLLLPFCFLVLDAVTPYVKVSYLIQEKSTDPSGLPARYVIKSVIWIGFFLLLLQGISDILKNLKRIRQQT